MPIQLSTPACVSCLGSVLQYLETVSANHGPLCSGDFAVMRQRGRPAPFFTNPTAVVDGAFGMLPAPLVDMPDMEAFWPDDDMPDLQFEDVESVLRE